MDFTTQQNVIGLYSLMPKEDMIINRRNLQEWFYEQKENNQDFFCDLKFDWDGEYPVSKEIDYIQSILRSVNYLQFNLIKGNYRISDWCRGYFERNMKPKMNEKELDEIGRLSKSLFDFLSSN